MAYKVSQEEYDKLKAKYREERHYDEMSDEDKEKFDKGFDEVVQVKDSDDTDEDDQENTEEKELEKESGNEKEKDDDDEYVL